jgi:hypothetical protein
VRLLWVLSLGQTLAIVFLATRLVTAAGEPPPVAASRARAPGPALAAGSAPADCRCPDAEQLRAIVVEELAAWSDAESRPAREIEPPATAPLPADPARFAQVQEEIERHIKVGVISDADMSRLQENIARLDPPARKRALGKLIKAMNAGLLEGRL